MNFTVYKSSAGSGKTFTLVKEYLKLALGNNKSDYYRCILAITFTNKAATEMKERVISTLKAFSGRKMNKSQSFMLSLIAEETGIASEELQLKSEEVLSSILHNYSDFNITTIDKFVHRIIRAFAFDLRIPMNFEVELDGQAIMADAVDVVLSRAGSEEELTNLLIDFAESRADEEGNWNIQDDIKSFAKRILDEDSSSFVNKLKDLSLSDFVRIKKLLRKLIVDFEEKISSIGNDGLSLISGNNIQPSSFQGGANGLPKYFSYLAELRDDKFEPSATVRKTTEEDKWVSGSCKPDQKNAIESISAELLKLYRDAQKLIQSELRRFKLYKLLYTRIYSMSLLNEIEKIISEFRSEDNRIHISEFNKRISEVVSREPAPFIYERIGEKFRHYLIDEFQDTSELQWLNLLPLIENSLANGCFNMLVGDGKQAIYRFRGGEVKQFANLPMVSNSIEDELLAERQLALKRNYAERVLNSNFRSKAEVVQFNNEFFRHLSHSVSEDRRSIYENLEQKFNPENSGGFVEFGFSNTDNKEYREEILNKVHETITEAISDGYRPGDIAILTRVNSQGSLTAEYLSSKGMQVSSSESLVLAGSREVRFIVSALRFLNAPFENSFRAEIIAFLYDDQVAEQKMRLIAKEDEHYFLSFLKNEDIALDPEALKLKSTYEVCEDILRIFNLKAEDPYILSFLDQVLQFNLKQNKSLPEFLDWWEEKKEKISIDAAGQEDAVKIMSIHKSKGLEFPVVICPFLNWKLENQKDVIWTESLHEEVKDLPVFLLPSQHALSETEYSHLFEEEEKASRLDDLNLLYVAMTRPVDRLHIFTTLPNRWGDLSKLFIDFLSSRELYAEERTHYHFGKKIKAAAGEKVVKSCFSVTDYKKTSWDKVVEISRESLRLIDEEQQEKISLGNLVHEVLSKVVRLEEIPRMLHDLTIEGLITADVENELSNKIQKLLKNTRLERLFTERAESRAEREIILPDGSFIRPDRVFFTGDEVFIVDYKTGKKRKKDEEQLHGYAEVLRRMGHEKIRKLLVYINEEELLEVQ